MKSFPLPFYLQLGCSCIWVLVYIAQLHEYYLLLSYWWKHIRNKTSYDIAIICSKNLSSFPAIDLCWKMDKGLLSKMELFKAEYHIISRFISSHAYNLQKLLTTVVCITKIWRNRSLTVVLRRVGAEPKFAVGILPHTPLWRSINRLHQGICIAASTDTCGGSLVSDGSSSLTLLKMRTSMMRSFPYFAESRCMIKLRWLWRSSRCRNPNNQVR